MPALKETAGQGPDGRLILREEIDRFFNLFEPTLQLTDDLIANKKNAQEILLLLCGRLDALASCLSSKDEMSRQSFINLVTNYAGYKDLMRSVSVGDLYHEIGFHKWLLQGMLPKPGRLHRFTYLDEPMINILDQCDIALTVPAVDSLLSRIIKALTQHFRCHPGQPRRKPVTAPPYKILD